MLPFFKPKKGFMIAGGGLDTAGGGGGGGGFPPFSTDETDTGMKWIDGKSIYMKSYYIESVTADKSKIDDLTNIDLMFAFGAVKFNSDNAQYSTPFYYTSSIYTNILCDSDGIYVRSNRAYMSNYKITIFYTKGE